ncbi:hypothetical protein BDN72DRAFT_856505 [Pluteus cervinus]|uniref:Uncharacterized protein n=1 Tax=Pluteus cervinus TaxID=181527 RepID=A0ACD3AYC4_9AGAR|nr:hypothetical protein BDN72DRAFT_856505 [Pluteus cervinus]
MSLPRHDPPGFVNDLLEENRQGWSDLISGLMLTDDVSPTLTPHFYDATKVKEQTEALIARVTWVGFPNRQSDSNNIKRWTKADASRAAQDEYLEWSIERAENGKIKKIVFSNEGPEYFEYLGKVQPDTLLKLYQDLHPKANIKKEDIFDANGAYIKLNKWNSTTTTGTIMHLVQVNNTLGAEIDLAGVSSILRADTNGNLITNKDDLIRYGKYGNPCRNSDPNIGSAINGIARGGHKLTVENPVGLYIFSVDWDQISPPDGHEDDNPKDFWKWTRGADGHHMRGEFEVPEEKGYLVGDLFVNDTSLDFGAQLADIISISITARYCDPNSVPPDTKVVNIQDKDTRVCPDITPEKSAHLVAFKRVRGRL